MTQKPIIGVLPSRHDNANEIYSNYLTSVWNAGGIPVLLPMTEDKALMERYAAEADGFLFTGGPDITPARYGDTEVLDSVYIDPERDTFEFTIFPLLLATGKPIFGICRGIQFLNVALGGTLVQHVDGHRQTSDDPASRLQPLTLEKGSLLSELSGKEHILVNSFHHQIIKDLAPSLHAEAWSDEGYIEAVSAPAHRFFRAVQFHPERYAGTPGDDHAGGLLKAFVDAAGQSL